MKHFIVILFTFSLISCFAQSKIDKQHKEILDEGIRLYRSEMASWYGTDLFLSQYSNKENIGGYLSYVEEEASICIFFSKTPNPQVLGTITFNKDYNVQQAKVDIKERPFSQKELDLYTIRQIALEDIPNDTLFKRYKNTNLNLVPLIHEKEKKVYVLTGPTTGGVVIFGNDYLITFDKKNKIRTKKQLHQNIIPIQTEATEGNHTILSTMHSHTSETGHLPTATDVCTLMLYAPYVNWGTHIIVSEEYKSIWDFKKSDFVALSNKTIDNIIQHSEKQKEN
ncbi:hypothetical protein [Myroides odoratus]|uniref:JAB domain-containing protein n=1 Tax=Myroides odoratus TaxID=256 RepID=A0A9Q7E7I1_MYROD|nr:hypothetical protein [Myroides odoratus]EHQ42137.1 hypothetical protein Myrod_1304 [Myroides odoratus DSM 2801]EKB09369.1 hypothetical protein HMPREF9716_00189 [Myroides odoratus CIP 103059]QQT99520.1 hypothetical protein I6I88_15245 [Myroides odoratus]WQD58273.1 hypothetical protein U0010_03710 [Myroides odoratus]STZ29397.1 Uncharacterised protein [Myroides odoratus]